MTPYPFSPLSFLSCISTLSTSLVCKSSGMGPATVMACPGSSLTKELPCWTTPLSRTASRLVLRASRSTPAMEIPVPAWPTRLIRR
ncbi:hypothetical protein B0I37DRAFT_233773 [Chaetomium sp. MPI-CAGE-AT-0009]|nr:hypothetical protein B0I37DRAFT_233773 [Chaetomium sp. MPI-CAGE-AT-0009]